MRLIESFNGRLRDECLNESVFHNIHHARAVIESWVQHYNRERPHSSLGISPRMNIGSNWSGLPSPDMMNLPKRFVAQERGEVSCCKISIARSAYP